MELHNDRFHYGIPSLQLLFPPITGYQFRKKEDILLAQKAYNDFVSGAKNLSTNSAMPENRKVY
jgi:hypothetical protein